MKIKQIGSNMTELHLNNGTIVLFSYETPVAAFKDDGFEQIPTGMKTHRFSTIRTDKFYSRTTSKHINKWISETTAVLNPASVVQVDQSVLDELVK